jgi:hypothetical protein
MLFDRNERLTRADLVDDEIDDLVPLLDRRLARPSRSLPASPSS